MSASQPDRVEALARVLRRMPADPRKQAERILAEPALVLGWLAEAGVLTEESRQRIVPVYEGDLPVDNALTTERRFVTEWRPADG